jgi:hypothetical protein
MEGRIVPGGYVALKNSGMSLGVITGINSDEDPTTRTGIRPDGVPYASEPRTDASIMMGKNRRELSCPPPNTIWICAEARHWISRFHKSGPHEEKHASVYPHEFERFA